MENKEKIIENPKNIFLFEIGFFILVQGARFRISLSGGQTILGNRVTKIEDHF